MSIHVDFELDGELGRHVLVETGEGGGYVDAAEYLRDLIKRDMVAIGAHQFRTVKEHLQEAFAAPESEYIKMDADEFLRWVKSSEA